MRFLTDTACVATAPTEAQLQAAIAVVCAMSEDEFYIAAKRIGLDPWSGMSNGSKASRRRREVKS